MNPWKSIPAEEYSGHMNHPAVNQQTFIAQFFENSIESIQAKRILLAGCATGNGLERLEGKDIQKIVAMDINEQFLRHVAKKFESLSNLELRNQSVELPIQGTFSLVFAALIFEYVDIQTTLQNFYDTLEDEGLLAVVIQLKSKTAEAVTPTPFESIQTISTVFRHRTEEEITVEAKRCGFSIKNNRVTTLESGKQFAEILFQKELK